MPLYMDVHYRVDGLTTAAVVEAHKQDLATQAKYGVQFVNYWYDETSGRVYCLAVAPNALASEACHREAHGLLADEIDEVNEYGDATPTGRRPLCMDMHFRIDGLTPEQVAEAVRAHIAAGERHGVRWLKAWYDAGNGRLFCLSESPTTDAHTAVHAETGFQVDEITQVMQGT